MENDKSLLEGIISDYFNSVEDAFQYRLKNEWKINTSQIILVFSVLFLTINVIPIVPALSKNYFLFLFDLLKERTILPFDQFNFWIKWLFGAIFSLVLFGLAFLFYIYWDRKNTKKALGYKFMSFCYIYSLRKELKSYLINDNEQHLEKCVKFFKNVFSKISIIDFKVDNRYYP